MVLLSNGQSHQCKCCVQEMTTLEPSWEVLSGASWALLCLPWWLVWHSGPGKRSASGARRRLIEDQVYSIIIGAQAQRCVHLEAAAAC